MKVIKTIKQLEKDWKENKDDIQNRMGKLYDWENYLEWAEEEYSIID